MDARSHLFITVPDLSLAVFGRVFSLPLQSEAQLLDLRLEALHLFLEVNSGGSRRSLGMSLLGIAQPLADNVSESLLDTLTAHSLDFPVLNVGLQISQILQRGSGVHQSRAEQLVQRGQLMSQAVKGLRRRS
jgi:hypothetical protein